MRIRYGRWTGTQDPFPADVSPDDVLEEISEDILGGLSPDEALERLLRRGLRGRAGSVSGLADLRRRVAEARRRELQRMGVDGPLDAIEQRLADIIALERAALDLSDDPAADAAAAQLDALPPDPAGRVAALQQYDWHDQGAAVDFADLLASLRRDVADATFGRLAAALGSMDEASLARTKDMLSELNELIARRDAGEDVTDDFNAFRDRYRDMLGSDAETLDELLEDMARRMAAMSRMMAGMTPEQREQLAQLAEQMLGDMDLAFQTEQLQQALRVAHPELDWDIPADQGLPGGDSGSLSSTVDWVQRLQEFEDLGQALGQDYPGARLDDVDEDALRSALGDDAVHDLRALRDVERVLEEAGVAGRRHGRLEMTPTGIRRMGEKSLATIYGDIADGAIGSHRAQRVGGDGELTGATRPWRFGDPFRIDIGRTVRNAILRDARGPAPGGAPFGPAPGGAPVAPGRSGTRRPAPDGSPAHPPTSSTGRRVPPLSTGVSLHPDDFELAEAERRVRVATVLLLDMSFSMPLRGNWIPAKRVALALQSLIDGQFPEDRFYVVGFSDFARRLQPADLIATGWEPVYGTNMQHAFLLARRLLSAHPDAQPQVIMVTDGEPTAHLEGNQSHFAWPPEPKTLRLAMLEAKRLARTGATMNVFLLDHDPGAARFIEQMVRTCGGRIFYPDLDDLGNVVVEDFLTGRHRRR